MQMLVCEYEKKRKYFNDLILLFSSFSSFFSASLFACFATALLSFLLYTAEHRQVHTSHIHWWLSSVSGRQWLFIDPVPFFALSQAILQIKHPIPLLLFLQDVLMHIQATVCASILGGRGLGPRVVFFALFHLVRSFWKCSFSALFSASLHLPS